MSMPMATLLEKEPGEATRRRALVLAWRLARGELVAMDAGDPEGAVLLELLPAGWTVEPGSAAGIVPRMW